MTLMQLKYVITVAGESSLNVAAKKLFISQPSLSTAIKTLEKEIGIEIFRRSKSGIVLTPEGQEFVGYARQVVEQYDLLDAKYIEKRNIKKKFSVSMQHYTFAVNAFVEMVKHYGMDEYEFAVNETKTHEVIDDVRNCISELGILYLNDFTLCSGIICEELNGSDYCAVKLNSDEKMSIGYISRKGSNISEIGNRYLEELAKFKSNVLI